MRGPRQPAPSTTAESAHDRSSWEEARLGKTSAAARTLGFGALATLKAATAKGAQFIITVDSRL